MKLLLPGCSGKTGDHFFLSFLFQGTFFHKYFLPGKGMDPRGIHQGGIGGRGGRENLHLFGTDTKFPAYELLELLHMIPCYSPDGLAMR